MAENLLFSAISRHFVKKLYTSTGNLFVSITSPGRWPLTSRRTALPTIMQGQEPRASASGCRWSVLQPLADARGSV